MAKIERTINHPFGLETGKKLVGALADQLLSKFGSFVSEIKWNDDKTAATVKGSLFDGNFVVSEKDVKQQINNGCAASLAKGKIEQEIDKHTTPEEMEKFAASVNTNNDSANA